MRFLEKMYPCFLLLLILLCKIRRRVGRSSPTVGCGGTPLQVGSVRCKDRPGGRSLQGCIWRMVSAATFWVCGFRLRRLILFHKIRGRVEDPPLRWVRCDVGARAVADGIRRYIYGDMYFNMQKTRLPIGSLVA